MRRIQSVICILLISILLVGLGAPSAAQAQVPGPQPMVVLEPVIDSLGVALGDAAWADYDNDGALDLLMTGSSNANVVRKTFLMRNDGAGRLAQVANSSLPDAELSSVDWADFNRDGYLDILLSGSIGYKVVPDPTPHLELNLITRVYRNDPETSGSGRTFTDISAGLPGIFRGRAAWGDYDNDGLPDILLTGLLADEVSGLTKLYHNNGNDSFSDSGITLPALSRSDAAWYDFNADGYLDLTLMGLGPDGPHTYLYRNDHNSGFTQFATLPGGFDGQLAWTKVWGSTPSLLITGNSGTLGNPIASTDIFTPELIFNTFVKFEDSQLPDAYNTDLAFGDYNNDGLDDLLMNGQGNGLTFTRLYLNNLASPGLFAPADFSYLDYPPPGDSGLSVAMTDVDGDLTLDLFMTGINSESPLWYNTFTYKNSPPQINVAPAAPQNLTACWDRNTKARFFWSSPTDDHSPAANLTYNVRVGTTSGGYDLIAPPTDPVSGANHLGEPGRFTNPNARLNGITAGNTYYWSVNAVDSSHATSNFAAQQTFTPNQSLELAQAKTVSTPEDQSLDIYPFFGSGASLYHVDSPEHGFLTTNTPGPTTLSAQTYFHYEPIDNFYGTDTFDYYTKDASGNCQFGTITVNVTAVDDDPPTLQWLPPGGVLQSSPADVLMGVNGTGKPFALTLYAWDPDNQTLTWSVSTPASHGAAVASGTTTSGQPKAISYTPTSGYVGDDTFTVQVKDSTDRAAVMVVNVKVRRLAFLPIVVR